MNTTIKIQKTHNASRSYGRGIDNFRVPARYDIVIDGNVVGRLWGKRQGYMESSQWVVAKFSAAGVIVPIHDVWNGGKKAAVAWIEANTDKF